MTSETLTPPIRLFPEDAPRLQVLYARCIGYFLRADGQPPRDTAGDEAFVDGPEGHARDQLALYGVFAPTEELVAEMEVLEGYPDAQTWWIGLMLVDPAARRQGIGRRMVEWLLARATERRVESLQLGVLDVNLEARRFWENMGFTWLRSTEPRRFGQLEHVVHVLSRKV